MFKWAMIFVVWLRTTLLLRLVSSTLKARANEPIGRVKMSVFFDALLIFTRSANTAFSFYGLCFILPSKGNSFLIPCRERRFPSYLSHTRLHPSLIYYSLPTKARVWLKITAIAISGEKAQYCSKVKITLRGHSPPKVHDGNCWQKKVTVTVKDLSIKTWCLLHFLQASIGFITDQN